MVLSSQTIESLCREHNMIQPFHYKTRHNGMTFGLSEAGYDIRLDQDIIIYPISLINLLFNCIKKRSAFILASSFEKFDIPNNIMFTVADKSSLARMGLCVQNTRGEPGWCGYLTLELTNHSNKIIKLKRGNPIAQIVFEYLDQPTKLPYKGKYQDQLRGPQPTILEII